MRSLFWIGLLVLILGVLSLVVPIPHREKEGIKIGDLSLGVETRHEDRVPPALSGVMILGGIGAMAVGKKQSA